MCPSPLECADATDIMASLIVSVLYTHEFYQHGHRQLRQRALRHHGAMRACSYNMLEHAPWPCTGM